MADYVGIIDQTSGAWGVRIPDLPGCYGAGESAEAAIRDAASAAREWIAHQEGSGHARPSPRAMSEILASSEIDVAAGEAAVLITVLIDEGRTLRANVTFDAGLLDAIDSAARERGLTRSAFLASAAREKIEARR
jgi:predicted RNase H-like HicB family nuclease